MEETEQAIEHQPGYENLSDEDCIQSLRARMHSLTFASHYASKGDTEGLQGHTVEWYRNNVDQAIAEIAARGGRVRIEPHTTKMGNETKVVHASIGVVGKSFVL